MQNAKRCTNRVAAHCFRKDSHLLDRAGSAESGARHSADPDKTIRTEGTENKPSLINTTEHGHEKMSHSDGTVFGILRAKHSYICGIVAHCSANESRRLREFFTPQEAQHEWMPQVHCSSPRGPL